MKRPIKNSVIRTHGPITYLAAIQTIALFIMSCTAKQPEAESILADNPEIERLFLKDVEIRELDEKTDTVVLERYDKQHRNRIFEMMAKRQVVTPMDKFRAALILQHTAGKMCGGELTSISPENFLLAYHLSSSALAELKQQKDSVTLSKQNFPRMIALNYDRYLLYTNGYQKYGTQFVFDDQTGEMLLAPIDTTLASDEERIEHQVKPLKELLLQHKMKPMPKE